MHSICKTNSALEKTEKKKKLLIADIIISLNKSTLNNSRIIQNLPFPVIHNNNITELFRISCHVCLIVRNPPFLTDRNISKVITYWYTFNNQ